jgi:hypothetical protein
MVKRQRQMRAEITGGDRKDESTQIGTQTSEHISYLRQDGVGGLELVSK